MSPDQQLARALRQWTHVFMHRSMRDFSRFMRRSGLSMAQVSTLFRLHYGGTCGISDVGGHLGVTNAAASQLVDRLVHQGLVERSIDPNDRRARCLGLTEAGRALIQESIQARQRWLEELTAHFDGSEQASIVIALDRLARAAQQLEVPY